MNKITTYLAAPLLISFLAGCNQAEPPTPAATTVQNSSNTKPVTQAQATEKETKNSTLPAFTKATTATLFTTAKDTELRLSNTGTVSFTQGVQPRENEISVFVNPNKRFQTMLGFGGAITDASAEVFAKLSSDKQEELLNAYYSKEGLNYTLARTTIHSSDFSSGSYTYIDEGDAELATFSIDHDRQFRIPMIKRAIETAGGELLMYASPWSPPAFMKSNKNMLHGGSLLPEYHAAWAQYYTKFIHAYEEAGIPIWGITVQNEPMATQIWESVIYSAEEERDFLKNHLGPTMEKAGLGDKNIIVWDHNRDLLSHRAHTIFSDPEAAKYAWGIGYHWYEVWTGAEPATVNLQNAYESYPDKHILFTEGTIESFDSERYQYWPNAERYGRDMITDFNAGTVGWTDWNILLDHTGGPNHVGNFCFAPVHADTRTNELIYTPTYYYLGHFSKFIQPGAKRVSTTSSQSFLLATSFVNPDGSVASIVMNKTDKPITFSFYVDDQEAEWTIPAHAIQTVSY